MSGNQCTYVDYGGGNHQNGRLRQIKVRVCGFGLRPRLNAGSVCDAQQHMWLAVLYLYQC